MLEFILGWDWKIRRLRRKWDRLREKTLKLQSPSRTEILKHLDSIEKNLNVLEEQNINIVAKKSLISNVSRELDKIKQQIEMERKRKIEKIIGEPV